MESNPPPEDVLAAAERAAVAPWIEYPPTPWWHEPSGGLMAGGAVLLLGGRGVLPVVLFVACAVVCAAAMGAWIATVMARQGAMPRLRHAPPEFVRVIRGYFIGCVVLVGVVAALYVVVDWRVAAGAAALGVWAGLLLYDRRYEAAAEAVRRRVA